MTSVFLLRLNKIDAQRTQWADYNDDYLEYHFLNQKTEMHYFQEKKKTLLNCELCDNVSLQLIFFREERDLPKVYLQKL